MGCIISTAKSHDLSQERLKARSSHDKALLATNEVWETDTLIRQHFKQKDSTCPIPRNYSQLDSPLIKKVSVLDPEYQKYSNSSITEGTWKRTDDFENLKNEGSSPRNILDREFRRSNYTNRGFFKQLERNSTERRSFSHTPNIKVTRRSKESNDTNTTELSNFSRSGSMRSTQSRSRSRNTARRSKSSEALNQPIVRVSVSKPAPMIKADYKNSIEELQQRKLRTKSYKEQQMIRAQNKDQNDIKIIYPKTAPRILPQNVVSPPIPQPRGSLKPGWTPREKHRSSSTNSISGKSVSTEYNYDRDSNTLFRLPTRETRAKRDLDHQNLII